MQVGDGVLELDPVLALNIVLYDAIPEARRNQCAGGNRHGRRRGHHVLDLSVRVQPAGTQAEEGAQEVPPHPPRPLLVAGAELALLHGEHDEAVGVAVGEVAALGVAELEVRGWLVHLGGGRSFNNVLRNNCLLVLLRARGEVKGGVHTLAHQRPGPCELLVGLAEVEGPVIERFLIVVLSELLPAFVQMLSCSSELLVLLDQPAVNDRNRLGGVLVEQGEHLLALITVNTTNSIGMDDGKRPRIKLVLVPHPP
mmetsp:Transcript_17583/g.32719  ORF Transcript_17583/g.32719 Transcript_17583/m.32719 type:complete len:254 (-) Transcript_17583:35-796(-)